MPWNKPSSIKLEDFPTDQLNALAGAYDEIRTKVRGMGEQTNVKMPAATSTDDRLAVLRRLEATGELWIRITYAGNLNVGVLMAPDHGEPDTYANLIRRPAMKRDVEPRR